MGEVHTQELGGNRSEPRETSHPGPRSQNSGSPYRLHLRLKRAFDVWDLEYRLCSERIYLQYRCEREKRSRTGPR